MGHPIFNEELVFKMVVVGLYKSTSKEGELFLSLNDFPDLAYTVTFPDKKEIHFNTFPTSWRFF